MARYFFDLNECGEITRDEEGREARDLPAAQWLAVQEARSVMEDEVHHGRLCLSCRIDIRDEAGAVRASVPFKEAVIVTGS